MIIDRRSFMTNIIFLTRLNNYTCIINSKRASPVAQLALCVKHGWLMGGFAKPVAHLILPSTG